MLSTYTKGPSKITAFRLAIADIALYKNSHAILVSVPKGQSRTGKDAENSKKDDQRSGRVLCMTQAGTYQAG